MKHFCLFLDFEIVAQNYYFQFEIFDRETMEDRFTKWPLSVCCWPYFHNKPIFCLPSSIWAPRFALLSPFPEIFVKKLFFLYFWQGEINDNDYQEIFDCWIFQISPYLNDFWDFLKIIYFQSPSFKIIIFASIFSKVISTQKLQFKKSKTKDFSEFILIQPSK